MGISLVCLDMHGDFHKLRRVARHSNEGRQVAEIGNLAYPASRIPNRFKSNAPVLAEKRVLPSMSPPGHVVRNSTVPE